jgi:hypothetical protein
MVAKRVTTLLLGLVFVSLIAKKFVWYANPSFRLYGVNYLYDYSRLRTGGNLTLNSRINNLLHKVGMMGWHTKQIFLLLKKQRLTLTTMSLHAWQPFFTSFDI